MYLTIQNTYIQTHIHVTVVQLSTCSRIHTHTYIQTQMRRDKEQVKYFSIRGAVVRLIMCLNNG